MEQRPSWEANKSSVSPILQNPNVHYLTHNRPPPVPTLSQIWLLKIHFNIILPSKPSSSKWSLSIRSPNQNRACTSPVLHTCQMPRPSHYSWFDRPNSIWRGVQIIKLRSPGTTSLLGPNILLNTLSLRSFLNFTSIQNNRRNYSYVYSNMYFFFNFM